MLVGAGQARLNSSQTAADLLGFAPTIATENESLSSELQSYEGKVVDDV